MSNQFVESTPSYQNNEFQWTHSANWLLINCYTDMVDEFRDPRNRKKDLWIQISDKFRELGYEISHEWLDKKFRNLKSTYQMIKKRNILSKKEIKWEYYKAFEDLVKGDELASNNQTNESKRITLNGKRLNHYRPSNYAPIEVKRKCENVGLSSSENTNEGVHMVTIEPVEEEHESVTIDDDSNGTRQNERIYELDIHLNDAHVDNARDAPFHYEENRYNSNKQNEGKNFNLHSLEAEKLQAETRYFNRKADYFEKQTTCLDIQRKLMIMQAHKLKLEIDQLKEMQEE